MDNPTAEPRGDARAGFAPVTKARSHNPLDRLQREGSLKPHRLYTPRQGPRRGCPRSSFARHAGNRWRYVEAAIPTQTPELVSIPLQSLLQTTRGKSSWAPFLQLILLSDACSSGPLTLAGL